MGYDDLHQYWEPLRQKTPAVESCRFCRTIHPELNTERSAADRLCATNRLEKLKSFFCAFRHIRLILFTQYT